jgi:parallel beta-helix repeat protein
MLTLTFSVQPVEASGTVYIRADGSIDPLTASISTSDNITYTLTSSIPGSIVVERDNIVLDGAGFTVQGEGNDTGIDLSNRNNVTIKNTNIKDFNIGVQLWRTNSTKISGNNVTANKGDGIGLGSSSNNSVSGNNVANNGYGIALYSSSNNSVSGNNVANNGYGIALYFSSNNSVGGNNVANNVYGMWLYSSNNSVSGNNITNNVYGIWLYSSSDNKFYHNNFAGNHPQVSSDRSSNVWDDGYPSGGNYWSNYNPPDEDKDKIGDSPYIIDGNNADKYPLIYPYEFCQPGYVPKHDINEDGTVDIIDIATVARASGCKPGDSNWNPVADMDINEIINIIDVAQVAKDFGK